MALTLSSLVDCRTCDTPFDGTWTDDSDTVQDMAEPPVQPQTCPNGHTHVETYPGWTFRSEAG